MKRILLTVLALIVVASLVLPVFAATTVKSIEQKRIDVVADEDGDVGTIHTPDGDVKVPFEALIVTNVVDADHAYDEHITIALDEAMNDIKIAETMSDLCAGLDDLVKTIDPNFTSENFVVADLFDATLINGYDEILHDDYATNIEITFDIGLTDATEEPVFIYRDEEGEWHIIDEENVTVNEDLTVTVFFLEICPIAILMTASGMVIENPDIVSPQTGVDWTPYVICGVAVIVAVAASVALMTKKKA